MARFTITVDDTLIADALAAWARIQDRRPVEQRQTLTIDTAWATACAIHNLGNILVADSHEINQAEANTAAQAHQLRVAQLIKAVSPDGVPIDVA